jgi:hypothetical protein
LSRSPGAAREEVEGEVGAGDQDAADVAEALQGGELFLLADAQGLVELSAGLEDVGDLALGDGDGADIAEAAVDGELFLLADAQGLVELSAGLEDVGDLALGDGDGADIAEAAVGRGCSCSRMRRASSSCPRAWRMSAILPWVTATERTSPRRR